MVEYKSLREIWRDKEKQQRSNMMYYVGEVIRNFFNGCERQHIKKRN